ncbi:hypothetical protein [Schlesneria paludicola]|uniref:hypothetical protein n=1 Tax=Schlesneria paludicola TaxID=360056 RepID=UPI00029A08F8|nr:hypothetical protein [Schlesneria paludicola]
MRNLPKAFIVISGALLIFACGWLTPRFEFVRALMATVLFGLPFVVACVTLSRNKPIKWHEYICFAGATLVIQGLMIALVCNWFNLGLDKKIQFERNFNVFRARLKENPEYGKIESYYEPRKGGHVTLKGEVKDKESFDRLTLLLQGFLLCQDVGIGYGDLVEYPGKPKRDNKL